MKVKIKKTDNKAVLPLKGSNLAAGFDLTAISEQFVQSPTGPTYIYGTGLSFEIPEGYVGKIYPRSSLGKNTTFVLVNHVGIIDADFRGEVMFQYKHFGNYPVKKYNVGDRIGQLIIEKVEQYEFEEVKELSDTKRGSGSYGSTGK